jgi:hypothetical protein
MASSAVTASPARGDGSHGGGHAKAVVTIDVDLFPSLPETASGPGGEPTDDRTQDITSAPTPQPEDQPTASSPPRPRPGSLSTPPGAPSQTGDTTAHDTGEATGPIPGRAPVPSIGARLLTKGGKRRQHHSGSVGADAGAVVPRPDTRSFRLRRDPTPRPEAVEDHGRLCHPLGRVVVDHHCHPTKQ